MSTKHAIITGAGTGVGRAVALMLAERGWHLAILGRTAKTLQETINLAAKNAENLLAIPCDAGDSIAVTAAMNNAFAFLGNYVDALINSAGTNIPKRSFADVSVKDYDELIDTNLNAAFYTTKAVLPLMRQQQQGTIINIGSDAGLFANPISGPAYIASKFGLTGLTAALNVEEKQHGIRACIIQPGQIDTPLMEKRPVIPDAQARAKMLQPEDIAACVALVLDLPPRAIIEEILIRPK